MTVTTQEIAAGNFSVRVPAVTEDEVGQLAGAFNRMAESLEKTENLRRTLMIDVAHELRTPLTNIRGYLEALTDEVLPPSKDTLALLHNETLRLAQLIEDVLQLARADASHGKLEREPADLKELVEAAAAPFANAFTQKSIVMRIHAPGGALIVRADRKRIGRVLRNLTDNAVRYTPTNGTLDIRIETDSRHARVEYSNDAEELSSTDLPYIFERFYRGEKSRSRRHGGAGIGLAIVKELVEAHNGSIGADLMDGRVRIWFTLPLGSDVSS
jgi:two-component system sensor histidine kinase BaeS